MLLLSFQSKKFFLHFAAKCIIVYRHHAGVMELVDVVDSKCSNVIRQLAALNAFERHLTAVSGKRAIIIS